MSKDLKYNFSERFLLEDILLAKKLFFFPNIFFLTGPLFSTPCLTGVAFSISVITFRFLCFPPYPALFVFSLPHLLYFFIWLVKEVTFSFLEGLLILNIMPFKEKKGKNGFFGIAKSKKICHTMSFFYGYYNHHLNESQYLRSFLESIENMTGCTISISIAQFLV